MARNTSDKSVSHPVYGMITSFEAVKVTAISGGSFTVFGGIGEYMFFWSIADVWEEDRRGGYWQG